MVRRFVDNPTISTRAVQIWQILVGRAHNRQTITYLELARLMHYRGGGILDRQLGHLYFYCEHNDLPVLSVLVVAKETGLPQGGVGDRDPNVERERVFGYDWFGMHPPTAEELAETYLGRR